MNKYRLNPFGRILHKFKIIKLYKNGNSYDFVWIWWNPLSWILCPILCLIQILLVGFPYFWDNREDVGLRIHPYIKKYYKDPFNQ